MARVCEITGKRPMVGHNVSHANNHTKRRFLPNLQSKSLYSPLLGHMVTLRLSTNAMRTIDKYDGIDNFMLNWKAHKTDTFSENAMRMRKAIRKKAETAALAAK